MIFDVKSLRQEAAGLRALPQLTVSAADVFFFFVVVVILGEVMQVHFVGAYACVCERMYLHICAQKYVKEGGKHTQSA